MRPGSRGSNMPGTSSGMPPGTGLRPGSGIGRKPPGTGRLRTGVAPSGPGTQAAQGVALSASISVLDRPVTGQGVMGMKTVGLGTGRLVEDNSYYIGLLRKKITDVGTETRKLRNEIDQQSKDNSAYTQLEKKYETLSKEKEKLEGQLADYNLAMDKTRTSTDPEDVQQQGTHLMEKNRQTGQELDRVFKSRKQKEEDTGKVEDQIEAQYTAIQNRINELEPGKLRAYNELLAKQRELQEKTMQCDNKLNEINEKVRHYETDDKTNIHRKEFSTLEKTYRTLKRDAEGLNEELEISNLDPKEAHTKFVARVNSFKQNTKSLDDKLLLMKTEITGMKKALEELASTTEEDSSEAAKYELLHKRDQDMTAFMDKFEETQEHVRVEQQSVRDIVCGLLEHIGRGLDETSQMPSQDALGEMEDQRTFKEKNLATAQRTMESLQAEKRKRERDLDLLRISEPKLVKELNGLKESISRMHRDMQGFQDIDGMKRAFENTKRSLVEVKQSYLKRRDTMRQQVQVVSLEYEGLKKAFNAHETGRELDDNEKRLKHNERTIFELKDFVETKSRETDYEALKGSCVKMLDVINNLNVKKIVGNPGHQFSGK